jgi:2-polyprenyl-6-methoxyphenol hydroxylase-like FAD-dependent oxidoreductase
MRILIIGGGIGGLCLAHGLRGAGIDVEVYERSTETAEGLAGYGIHVNADGCRALSECLPEDNRARFDAVAGHARNTVRFSDEHLRTLAVRDGDLPADPALQRRAVGRIALREVLLHGLSDGPRGTEGVVRWGKEFTGYDHTADGRPRAHFADGGHAVGDLLIGADGSNSRVRRQYLPELHRLDVGVLNIAGRYPLTPQNAARLPATLIDGSVNNIVPPRSGWMFVSAWRAPREHGDTDYAVWAYAAARRTYPSDVRHLGPEGLRDLVLARIDGWAPALRALVADCDPSTVSPVSLHSMPVLRPWPSSTVTLLGDAIHNMTPMAGVGANTALRDAGVLRRALIEVVAGRRTPVDAIADYEREMRDYANRAIGMSLRNARNAGSDTRLPRQAFRTMLRVAQAVPPIKRVLFSERGSVASHGK